MNTKSQTVTVNIMGKEYRIACEAHERECLIKSAHDLNDQMCKMRDSGKVVGPERIAVMAALNLSHELETLKNNHNPIVNQHWKEGLASMFSKIENILENR